MSNLSLLVNSMKTSSIKMNFSHPQSSPFANFGFGAIEFADVENISIGPRKNTIYLLFSELSIDILEISVEN